MNSEMQRARDCQKQDGAVLVEFAITVPLFILVVMGIFEVALLMFDWNLAVEATRTTARTMVVNDAPAVVAGMDCDDSGATPVSFTCTPELCGKALVLAQSIAPKLENDNIRITYQCTSAGFEGRPEELPVYSLTAELEGFTSTLRIPAMLGFPRDIEMPGFETTRITEDLHTP